MALAREALKGGQDSFEVHAFPFRMTDENMARYKDNPNYTFWQTMKQGYDYFEKYRLPPAIAVCDRHYVVNVKAPVNATVSIPTPPARAFTRPVVDAVHAQAHRAADRRGAHRRAGPEAARDAELRCRQADAGNAPRWVLRDVVRPRHAGIDRQQSAAHLTPIDHGWKPHAEDTRRSRRARRGCGRRGLRVLAANLRRDRGGRDLRPRKADHWHARTRAASRFPARRNFRTCRAVLRRRARSSAIPSSVRIFKREFELELWLKRDGRFQRFATYPICMWSGALGPKLREGDKQAPEGFYTVDAIAAQSEQQLPPLVQPRAFPTRSIARTAAPARC